MSEGKMKILFIAGHTRSGSTLLDRMLGQMDGFFSIGEVRGAWDALENNWLCECGQPLRKCEFWSKVMEEAFGGFHNVDLSKVAILQKSTSRIRYLPKLVFPRLQNAKYKEEHVEYLKILKRFYYAIWKVSGAKMVIDSSKNPAHGFLLHELPNVELKVVHLIRDSRAVAYSWLRKRRRPEVTSEEAYQATYRPFISAIQWTWANMAVEWLCRVVGSSVRVRYEDLVEDPQGALLRIFDALEIGKPHFDFFVDAYTIRLSSGHTIFGNPMRMQKGVIRIRMDTEWQQKLPSSQRLLVTMLTWPLLARYGYLGGGMA